MPGILEPTAEAITDLLLRTYAGVKDMEAELESLERRLPGERDEILDDLGMVATEAFLGGTGLGETFHAEAKRREEILYRQERMVEILRVGLDRHVPMFVKDADERISKALTGYTLGVRARDILGENRPISIRRGSNMRPARVQEASGSVMSVDSRAGVVLLEHPIESTAWQVQVIGMHRGAVLPLVELSEPVKQMPRLHPV